jgi:hypothetical protein
LNEWGEYIGKTNDDVRHLGMYSGKHPAITFIEAWFFPDMEFHASQTFDLLWMMATQSKI